MTPLILSLALTAAQPPIPLPLPQPAPQPVPQLPQPIPQPVPAPRALTLTEFSRYFTPIPGKHDVWVVHPDTRRPVLVCFTLPDGRMRQFEVEDRSIRFEFNKCDVEIEFRKNGTVKVEYDD
jgi:hypothetical protein